MRGWIKKIAFILSAMWQDMHTVYISPTKRTSPNALSDSQGTMTNTRIEGKYVFGKKWQEEKTSQVNQTIYGINNSITA